MIGKSCFPPLYRLEYLTYAPDLRFTPYPRPFGAKAGTAPEAIDKPKVGGFVDFSAEKTASLKPDLVPAKLRDTEGQAVAEFSLVIFLLVFFSIVETGLVVNDRMVLMSASKAASWS